MDLDDLANEFAGEAQRFEKNELPPLSDKAIRIIKILISADIKENFAGSHDPDGNPWPPLKQPRKGSKADPSKGEVDKPLLDWGVLMANAAAAGHQQDVATITAIARGLRVEMDGDKIRGHDGTVQGNWHRLGTSRGIPAREFLGISAACAERIAEVVAEDAAEQLGK